MKHVDDDASFFSFFLFLFVIKLNEMIQSTECVCVILLRSVL